MQTLDAGRERFEFRAERQGPVKTLALPRMRLWSYFTNGLEVVLKFSVTPILLLATAR